MAKILLVLESDMMQKSLSEALTNHEICTCPADEAADVLAQFQPDALILDLFLPGIDGFILMENCKVLLPPVILMLSVLDSDYIRKKAAQSGADFVIQKPCAIDYIVRHLTDMLLIRQFPAFSDDEALVDHLLSQFHIHAKERVIKSLRNAILLGAADPNCLLTKDIYSEVRLEYGASTDAVDQAIRRCLRNAWLNRFKHTAGWDLFFPGYKTCPSNGVFISTLSAHLRKKYPSRFRKGS